MLSINASLNKSYFGPPMVKIISALVIEAIYLDTGDKQHLLNEYLDVEEYYGHVCNNAQFEVLINNVVIGTVNMNNQNGNIYPYNDSYNFPTPISKVPNTWNGSRYSRYSRIDISEEQAQIIVSNSGSETIQIFLRALSNSPHNDITWLRISLKDANGLKVVENVRMISNIFYPVKVTE